MITHSLPHPPRRRYGGIVVFSPSIAEPARQRIFSRMITKLPHLLRTQWKRKVEMEEFLILRRVIVRDISAIVLVMTATKKSESLNQHCCSIMWWCRRWNIQCYRIIHTDGKLQIGQENNSRWTKRRYSKYCYECWFRLQAGGRNVFTTSTWYDHRILQLLVRNILWSCSSMYY